MYRYTVIAWTGMGGRGKYGLLAERRLRDSWCAVAVTADLSRDRAFVSSLAETFTRLQLDPLHLADVILDVLP